MQREGGRNRETEREGVRNAHWHNLEHEVVSQNLGVQAVAAEVVHDAFHHPTEHATNKNKATGVGPHD